MTKPELEMCMETYGKHIFSFCLYLTGSRQEAEDLYQDTFLKAMELNETIDMDKNPKSYLLAVSLRIWKNRKRKYAWRRRIADSHSRAVAQDGKEAGELGMSPEEQVLKKETMQAVRRTVSALPERLRVIVLLYYMEELSVAQIASIVKIPQGTVKSRLYQARKMLQKELEVVFDERRYG